MTIVETRLPITTIFLPSFFLSDILSHSVNYGIHSVRLGLSDDPMAARRIFSPKPPPPHADLCRPKIAAIGTGLTGVSAAAHCVVYGFDVTGIGQR
jgi:hypothetical protein